MDERSDTSDELSRITLAYIEGRERGDGPTLEELARSNPRYASELIDFATDYYVAEEAGDDGVPECNDLAIERQVLEEAFAQLRHLPALTNLMARARERGFATVSALAEKLDLGADVVTKLDQRLIVPDRSLEVLLEPLAGLIAVSLQQLRAFFSASPRMATEASFYAPRQPTVEKRQTFADTIRSSRLMTPEQKAKWLAAMGEPFAPPKSQEPARRGRKRR